MKNKPLKTKLREYRWHEGHEVSWVFAVLYFQYNLPRALCSAKGALLCVPRGNETRLVGGPLLCWLPVIFGIASQGTLA